MNTKQKVALIAGAVLLGWWYLRQRAAAATPGGTTPDPMASASGLLTSLTSGKAAENPLSQFSDFLGVTNAVAEKSKPIPPADSWVWTDNSLFPWDVQPIQAYETWFSRWGDSKCQDKQGNPTLCEKVGKACIRGWNCKPGDPGYK